ncbi:MAG TPA: class I SAM-dependent methyltransferase [Candidatus Saccharimonadales bacterium]|jgi:SAM-dependent methyltransferase|nr:class I SAM-dependent methyltransferase [Candidatus Saccharimonadales bacterium]
MNALENWFCSTSFWRKITREQLLPWTLGSVDLGNHLLEIGAGAGAATAELQKRVPRITSLEYDHALVARLAQRNASRGSIVQGDSAALPFADGTFTSAIAVLMLHHLRSSDLQDRAFAEVHRVLRPGGCFCAFDIQDGWLNRVVHIKSTFVPIQPQTLTARLARASFVNISVDSRSGAFRFHASKGN